MLTRLKQIVAAFSPGERRTFLISAIVAIASLVVLGGYFLTVRTEVVPAKGGTYAEGMMGQPTYVNPVLAATALDRGLVRLLFANLPALAEKIESDEEGRVIRVRLKENLFWSDGAELTSDDVIFTVQKIQEIETGSPLFSSLQGVVASRGSKLEVLFRLGNAYPLFTDTLEGLYVIPKHIFAEVPGPNWRLSDYNLRPVGSGPYAFASYEKRQDGFIRNYHFEENDRYPGPKPLLASFDVAFYPNEQELLEAFNAGQIDGFVSPSLTALEEIARPHEIIAFDSPTTYAIFWNQSQNLPLQYPEVRKALEMAVDRAGLVAGALHGLGKPAEGPVPPGFSDFALPLARSGADVEGAKTLLEKSGWTHAEGSAVRTKLIKKTELPLSFTVLVPDIQFLKDAAQTLVESWRAIGAEVELAFAPTEDITNSAIKNRNYQSLLFGNNVRKTGDLFAFWHSSERFYPGLNLALYNNKKADQLMETIRIEKDPALRAAKIKDLQEMIVSDAPAVFLFSPDYLYVVRKDVRGISPRLLEDIADRFLEVAKWHLETARVLKG